jgi:hypothetical protein
MVKVLLAIAIAATQKGTAYTARDNVIERCDFQADLLTSGTGHPDLLRFHCQRRLKLDVIAWQGEVFHFVGVPE